MKTVLKVERHVKSPPH